LASPIGSSATARHWIERDGAVWLVRRPAKGLLGGMAALPGDDWSGSAPPANAMTQVAHVFTHFELRLSVVAKAEPEGEGWWHPIADLGGAGLPTLYRKAATALLAKRASLAAAA